MKLFRIVPICSGPLADAFLVKILLTTRSLLQHEGGLLATNKFVRHLVYSKTFFRTILTNKLRKRLTVTTDNGVNYLQYKMEGDIFVFQTLFLANHLVVTIALSADVSNVTIRYLSPYISIRSALSVFPHRGFVNLIVRKSNLCLFGYNPNSVGSNPNSLVYRSVISDWEWFSRIQILVVPQRVRLK